MIAEQEKDLACINEEKRYFQMRLMALEKHLEGPTEGEEEEFAEAADHLVASTEEAPPEYASSSGFSQNQSFYPALNGPICIPPTIPECDDCDE